MRNNHEIVRKLILKLGGIYRNPNCVISNVTSLLNSTHGKHLRPDIQNLLQNDGSQTRSLRLSGTITIVYRGNEYFIPVDMYLPPNYGVRPPIIFVRPVATMMIKQNHQNVAMDGAVFMPYLHGWQTRSHDLIGTVTAMSNLFGLDPPVFAKPPGASTNGNNNHNNFRPPVPTPAARPPPPQYNDAAADQERLRRIEREAAAANEAVRIAREADQAEARELADLKQKLDDKCKFILQNYYHTSVKEITGHLEDKILLEKSALYVNGKSSNAGCGDDIYGIGQLEYWKKKKNELLKHHADVDTTIANLEAFIREAEKSKKTSKEIPVDELAVPADIRSAQMLVLSAENAAIHDALYYLDKGLSDNKIALDVHLNATRKLAKRQFLIKAHLLKIGQVKASEVSMGVHSHGSSW
jgi:ESCRT-I complex subunit TSG101